MSLTFVGQVPDQVPDLPSRRRFYLPAFQLRSSLEIRSRVSTPVESLATFAGAVEDFRRS